MLPHGICGCSTCHPRDLGSRILDVSPLLLQGLVLGLDWCPLVDSDLVLDLDI